MARRPNPRNANGHRRRQARTRVLAEETHCALCRRQVDTTLPHGLPTSPEVDENIPVSRGGSPIDRANLALMHRACNQWKSNRTLKEALATLATGTNAQPIRTAPVEHSNTW